MTIEDAPRALTAHHPHCLGCGPQNPGTLGLRFTLHGERVRAALRLDERHSGAPGFAHGGALATALDDTIGTLLVILRRPAVTARLEVDYRRPAFLDHDYEVEAWIERIEGRKLHLAGAVRDGDETIADARALFLEVDLEHFAQGGADLPDRIREHWGRVRPELPY
jgi:acyl-coenzyme A thioesterase PaaI-like protein